LLLLGLIAYDYYISKGRKNMRSLTLLDQEQI